MDLSRNTKYLDHNLALVPRNYVFGSIYKYPFLWNAPFGSNVKTLDNKYIATNVKEKSLISEKDSLVDGKKQVGNAETSLKEDLLDSINAGVSKETIEFILNNNFEVPLIVDIKDTMALTKYDGFIKGLQRWLGSLVYKGENGEWIRLKQVEEVENLSDNISKIEKSQNEAFLQLEDAELQKIPIKESECVESLEKEDSMPQDQEVNNRLCDSKEQVGKEEILSNNISDLEEFLQTKDVDPQNIPINESESVQSLEKKDALPQDEELQKDAEPANDLLKLELHHEIQVRSDQTLASPASLDIKVADEKDKSKNDEDTILIHEAENGLLNSTKQVGKEENLSNIISNIESSRNEAFLQLEDAGLQKIPIKESEIVKSSGKNAMPQDQEVDNCLLDKIMLVASDIEEFLQIKEARLQNIPIKESESVKNSEKKDVMPQDQEVNNRLLDKIMLVASDIEEFLQIKEARLQNIPIKESESVKNSEKKDVMPQDQEVNNRLLDNIEQVVSNSISDIKEFLQIKDDDPQNNPIMNFETVQSLEEEEPQDQELSKDAESSDDSSETDSNEGWVILSDEEKLPIPEEKTASLDNQNQDGSVEILSNQLPDLDSSPNEQPEDSDAQDNISTEDLEIISNSKKEDNLPQDQESQGDAEPANDLSGEDWSDLEEDIRKFSTVKEYIELGDS